MAFWSVEDLETLRGKAQLVPGASGIPSLHPQVAQPFLQRHACHLLTGSRARLKCQLHKPFLEETKSLGVCGGADCVALGRPVEGLGHPCFFSHSGCIAPI